MENIDIEWAQRLITIADKRNPFIEYKPTTPPPEIPDDLYQQLENERKRLMENG